MNIKSLSRMPASGQAHDSFIPNFCGSRAVWRVVLSVELVAVLLALAGALGVHRLWPRLFLLSLYLQWIGLMSCAALCLARPWLERQSSRNALWLTFLLLIAVTFAISEIAYAVDRVSGLSAITLGDSRTAFVVRNLLICIIVSAVLLRYLYLQYLRDSQRRASAEARFVALQARMRPHFLFNSFNSIAALIAVDPAAAEEMVLDLAELFRASLNNMEGTVPLEREMEITRMYINIESARLGERLKVTWQVDAGLDQLQVPILTLQPLVENAVYHGIQKRPQGGEIRIAIRREAEHLVFQVDNPLPETNEPSRGQQIALDNITQRLRLLFGEAAAVELQRGERQHCVRLTLPVKGGGDETAHR